jgi:hypothetical protein
MPLSLQIIANLLSGRRSQRTGVGKEEISPDGWLKTRGVSARTILFFLLFCLPARICGGGTSWDAATTTPSGPGRPTRRARRVPSNQQHLLAGRGDNGRTAATAVASASCSRRRWCLPFSSEVVLGLSSCLYLCRPSYYCNISGTHVILVYILNHQHSSYI